MPRKTVTLYMQVIGKRGGRVKGPCKRRGDSEHYRKMALIRWGK